jgi:hypothetical protein
MSKKNLSLNLILFMINLFNFYKMKTPNEAKSVNEALIDLYLNVKIRKQKQVESIILNENNNN